MNKTILELTRYSGVGASYVIIPLSSIEYISASNTKDPVIINLLSGKYIRCRETLNEVRDQISRGGKYGKIHSD